MKPMQSPSWPLRLPRQLNRVLGKLRNLPAQDGLAIVKFAYDRTHSPHHRSLAMRLRLRLLQEHYAGLHAVPHQPEIIKDTPPPLMAEIVTRPAETISPAPPAPKKQPKMMMMNLETNDLSAMMDALSDPSKDAV